MVKFEDNTIYHVNKGIDPYNIFIIKRTNCYARVRIPGKTLTLKIRNGFFGSCEHLLIPTEYKNITVFCTARNKVTV